ncbi:MAG: hypothetical protein L6Q78_11100 [Bacteroidia bacterium]|nr:hypothetical protein [Bacteroidia bacterium]
MDGRKTMTRRVVKPQPSEKIKWDNFGFSALTPAGHIEGRGKFQEGYGSKFFKCKYGQPGDVLWVRESCTYVIRDHAHDLLEGSRDGVQWVYKSSMHEDWMKYAKEKYGYKWKPSIHMPKEACRLFLQITNIRVERLQDINSGDAISEGIEFNWSSLFSEYRYKDYMNVKSDWRSPISSFQSLWASINGLDSWEANPWVWVIEFKKLEGKPDGF